MHDVPSIPVVPTGSRLELAARCPASHVLAQSPVPETEAAERGQDAHLFLQHAGADREAALRRIKYLDIRRRLATFDRPELRAPWEREMTYRLDVVSGKAERREIGSPRAYPHEDVYSASGVGVWMTLDCAKVEDGVAEYTDWKTGFAMHPRDSLQIKAGLAALARAHGVSAGVGRIVRIPDEPDAEPYVMEHAYDAVDLDAAAMKVRHVVGGVQAMDMLRRDHPEREIPTNPGNWCRFCPAQPACPAQRRALDLAVRIEPADLDRRIQDAGLYQAYLALEELTKRVRQELEIRAGRAPIPIGGGKVWGPMMRSKRTVDDGEKAYAALRELLGDELANKAVTRDTNLTAIKDVVREHVKATKEAEPTSKLTIAGLMSKIEAKLLEVGALEENTWTSFTAFNLAPQTQLTDGK
jgi:hypothetical protein